MVIKLSSQYVKYNLGIFEYISALVELLELVLVAVWKFTGKVRDS